MKRVIWLAFIFLFWRGGLGLMAGNLKSQERELASLGPREILGWKALDEKNIHYFHNHLILNYHFYVSNEKILLLDQQTEAALALYREKGERINLLPIRYPDAKKAEQAYQSFTHSYLPDAKEPGRVKTEDNKWTVAKIKSNLLTVVFNAPSEALAEEMIRNVAQK